MPGNKPKSLGDGPLRPEEISCAKAHPTEPFGGRTANRMRPNNWRGKIVNALKERHETICQCLSPDKSWHKVKRRIWCGRFLIGWKSVFCIFVFYLRLIFQLDAFMEPIYTSTCFIHFVMPPFRQHLVNANFFWVFPSSVFIYLFCWRVGMKSLSKSEKISIEVV